MISWPLKLCNRMPWRFIAFDTFLESLWGLGMWPFGHNGLMTKRLDRRSRWAIPNFDGRPMHQRNMNLVQWWRKVRLSNWGKWFMARYGRTCNFAAIRSFFFFLCPMCSQDTVADSVLERKKCCWSTAAWFFLACRTSLGSSQSLRVGIGYAFMWPGRTVTQYGAGMAGSLFSDSFSPSKCSTWPSWSVRMPRKVWPNWDALVEEIE